MPNATSSTDSIAMIGINISKRAPAKLQKYHGFEGSEGTTEGGHKMNYGGQGEIIKIPQNLEHLRFNFKCNLILKQINCTT